MATEKTNWSVDPTKPKTIFSEANKVKTAFSESAKVKTAFSVPSKEKSDWQQSGDGSYTFIDPVDFDSPSVDFDEGECLFDGPLRVITFSAGKEKTSWS